jgi:hypothetical protein
MQSINELYPEIKNNYWMFVNGRSFKTALLNEVNDELNFTFGLTYFKRPFNPFKISQMPDRLNNNMNWAMEYVLSSEFKCKPLRDNMDNPFYVLEIGHETSKYYQEYKKGYIKVRYIPHEKLFIHDNIIGCVSFLKYDGGMVNIVHFIDVLKEEINK